MSMRTFNFVLQRLIVVNNSKSVASSFFSTSSLVSQAAPQASSASSVPPPNLDGQPKEYSAKIQTLVDEISKLNLIEVSDLNELLRKRLNIRDVPMAAPVGFMPAGAAGAGGASAKKADEEEKSDDMPKATKSSFKVKLVKFDETKKVALIKEIKSLVENMNLVQAKKFVEASPQVLKNDVSKDDAEKLKAQLEKVGATIEIE